MSRGAPQHLRQNHQQQQIATQVTGPCYWTNQNSAMRGCEVGRERVTTWDTHYQFSIKTLLWWLSYNKLFYLSLSLSRRLLPNEARFRNTTLLIHTGANDRRSVSEWAIMLAGAMIAWSSKRKPMTAIISTESEFNSADAWKSIRILAPIRTLEK